MENYALDDPIEFAEHGPLYFWLDLNKNRGYVEFNISDMRQDESGVYPILFSAQLSEVQFTKLAEMFDDFYITEVE